jgi:hypothetical protein
LRARDSGVFKELKSLFSTTPEVGKETEANGGHRGDRTLHRTRSRYDRTRPVSIAQTRVLGFATGVSGHSRDWRVQSGAQKELRFARTIGCGTRSVTHDRTRPIVEGAYWTLTRRGHCRVRLSRGAHPVMSLRARYCAIGASGRCQGHVRSMVRRHAIGASGRLSGASGRLTSVSGRCLGRVRSLV